MRLTRRNTLQKSWLRRTLLPLPLTATLGCRRAPSFDVLGSYFPGWIACMIAAVLLTAAIRWILNKTGIEDRLPVLPIFYFSLAVLIACLIWLITFE